MRKWLSTGALLLAASSVAVPAGAEPLPLETRVRVGRPARPVTLRVEGPSLTVRGRRGETSVELAIAEPTAARVEEVSLAGGGRVAVVRVEGSDQRAAALVVAGRDGPQVLWSGRLDAHGDPGERRAATLEVADRTGDGHPDVIVGRTRESTRVCGQERTLLFPHAVHPRTLELRPVVLRRLPEQPGGGQRELTARTESPGPEGAPVLDRLRVRSASSMTGMGDEPAQIPPPTALTDSDPGTVWLEGHGSAGRWEFVTARFDGGRFPIRAVAITPSPSGPERARALGRPRSLWLVGDRGPRLHVTLPDDPAGRPGEPYWIVPDRPLHWRCLSIVLDEVIEPKGAREGEVRTGLAEVAVYTDLDFGEGLEPLVDELGDPGTRGSEAAGLLASVGPRVVPLLHDAWEGLSPRGRQRAIRALRPHLAESERARTLVLGAATEGNASVRRAAFQALAEDTGATWAELATLAEREGEVGDRAAGALAAADPQRAVPVLLRVLSQPRAPSRPAVRRALGRAVAGADEAGTEAVRAWLDGDPDPAAVAAAALGLSSVEGRAVWVNDLIAQATGSAERFADRWRLVKAARATPSHAAVDRWLAGVARDAEPWMLRAAALTALAHRNRDAAMELAGRVLADPYPRVRSRAVRELGDDRRLMVPVAKLARRDEWPLVRSAAVRALAAHEKALPVVRAAVHDPAATVRRAAIETATEARDRGAWAKVRDRLADAREDGPVRSATIAYAHRLCLEAAVPPLAEIVEHAMAPDATVRDRDLAAEAIRALVAIGGDGAREALRKASGERAPAQLRATVARARRHEDGCRGPSSQNP